MKDLFIEKILKEIEIRLDYNSTTDASAVIDRLGYDPKIKIDFTLPSKKIKCDYYIAGASIKIWFNYFGMAHIEFGCNWRAQHHSIANATNEMILEKCKEIFNATTYGINGSGNTAFNFSFSDNYQFSFENDFITDYSFVYSDVDYYKNLIQ